MTEEAVQEAYDARYSTESPDLEYNASHILVETEEEALALIEELDGGADFAELAREHSTGPSGPNGGSLFPGTNALFPTRMPGLVIGSAPFQFALRGARPNQPTIFRIAFPGGPGGGGGLCDLTRRIIASPFDIPDFTSASGGASVTIPIPCDPQLIGELFYGQWITVNPGIPLSCPFPGLSGLEIAASTVVQYEIGG